MFSNMVLIRDPPNKSVGGWEHEGFVVPPEGGYVRRHDVNGNIEFWGAQTNYPAPYWNEWIWTRHLLRGVGPFEGPFRIWWYGEWV